MGYYGGAINGITVYLEYEVSGVWYTYSTTISGDMTIIVTIGSSGVSTDSAYFKVNGTWRQVSEIYKKINGTWVKQTDFDNVFTSGVRYKS